MHVLLLEKPASSSSGRLCQPCTLTVLDADARAFTREAGQQFERSLVQPEIVDVDSSLVVSADVCCSIVLKLNELPIACRQPPYQCLSHECQA
jgi:hypothetical protein